MSETHELRLKINAAAAESGARKFTTAVEAVKRSIQDLDRSTDGTFTKLRKGAKPQFDVTPLTRATTATEKLSTATDKAAATIQRTALASASALRTSEQAAQRLALRMGDLGDARGLAQLNDAMMRLRSNLVNATSTLDVRSAKSQFDDLRSSLLQNAVAAEYLRGEQAQLARQTEEAARSAADQAAQMDRLRAKYNPLYQASKAYETAIEEIALAEREGAISAKLAADARQRAAQQLAGVSTVADQHTAAMRRNNSVTQNGILLGHQISDIFIVSSANFQSLGQTVIQQGSQISSQLATMRAGGVNVFRTLLSSVTSLINPLSLVALGAVAAGSLIIRWFSSSAEETKSFGDALSDASSKIQALRSASDALATGNLSNLRREYGAVNEELRIHLERLQQVAKIDARNVNRDLIASIEDALTSDGNPFTGSVDEVRRAFDTTNDSARHMLALMQDIQTAATFEEQAASVTRLRSEVERVTGGLGRAEGKALDALTQLIKSEDAAKKLMAAQDGTSKATARAANAASSLSTQLGTAADSARQLLATLGAVPGAVAALGRSVDDQIAAIQSENKSLSLQLDLGLSSQAANRRVQLDDLLNSGAMTPDQAVSEFAKIQELEGLAKTQAALRKQLSEANSSSKSGGRAAALSGEAKALEQLNDNLRDRLLNLRAERMEMDLLSSGHFQTAEGARAMAEAMIASGGAVDGQTAAMIRQIDVAAKLNEELRKVAEDPVKKWMDSVPNWVEAGQKIESGAINHVKGAISEMMQTGKFDIESLGQAILGTISDIVADKAVAELANVFGRGEGEGLGGVLGGLFSSQGDELPALGTSEGAGVAQGGVQAGQSISQAMIQAGQQVSQNITAAMTQGGQQAGQAQSVAISQGGSQAANAQRVAGIQHGHQVRLATQTSGQQHATKVKSAIDSGANNHAQAIQMASSSSGGGGIWKTILGALGGGSGILSTALSFLPMVFKEGGLTSNPHPVNFQHAPHFSEGTANTSGIPAVLHPNEAVIPLSKGRKIPVEMGGANGAAGNTVINQPQTFNITTPDSDSFRRSRSQIEADMARSGQRSLSKNS